MPALTSREMSINGFEEAYVNIVVYAHSDFSTFCQLIKHVWKIIERKLRNLVSLLEILAVFRA